MEEQAGRDLPRSVRVHETQDMAWATLGGLRYSGPGDPLDGATAVMGGAAGGIPGRGVGKGTPPG
jgi:hypothetical protein